eukprot:CAMPEP_0176440768 /NCGR_PEP_ID=MMETSP0127-20121128/20777_1 /TAXON_ID=938130 /ORGANISM="Platyophrya macrostoma, Strain WH" /LENGTH=358 /DNA_ID=CAMNT_0017825375 /DNA_START=95 /DNA_END=1171 /DNA_ORIENTATION=+
MATGSFPEMMTCLLYPYQTNEVITQDGYKLTIFRIQAKYSKISGGKPVVLLWHGLLDSADTWVINEEHLAPALVLANKGYDVWLGNSRGNKYSLNHKTLDSKSSKDFWNFSWQKMAEYDLPATFEFIASITKQKITYIGHSQGTTIMFAALSDPTYRHPSITSNMKKFAALGPVAYTTNLESKAVSTLIKIPLLPEILQKVAAYGFLMPNWLSSEGGKKLCSWVPFACKLGLKEVFDARPEQDNENRLDYLGGHFPAGTSVQNVLHWMQEMKAGGTFQKYDHGRQKNYVEYGQSTPLQYDASLIQEEVGLFAGEDDLISSLTDVDRWYSEMSNAKKKEIHYYPMGHLTFVIGKEHLYG